MDYSEDIVFLRNTTVFKTFVRETLGAGIVKITFEKADGTPRTMLATTKEGLTVITESKTGRTKKENPEVCVVFDTEKQEWRSFRWDRLINFELNTQ
jgi:hypothetical protein